MSATARAPRPAAERHSRSVRLLHTSDVHVGRELERAREPGAKFTTLTELQRLVELAARTAADLLLITGDFFDHNRIDAAVAQATAELLERARIPVVILPGNHDPYTPHSVYRRHAFPENVRIFKEAAGELIALPEAGVQIWGQAHTDYFDFAPAASAPAWLDGTQPPLWRIAAAHGLYVRSDYEARLSYRIHSHELSALQAHYVGLGHLEQHERIDPFTYYAGAPDRIGGATVVDLTPAGITVMTASFA